MEDLPGAGFRRWEEDEVFFKGNTHKLKDGFSEVFPKKSSSQQWGYFLGKDLPLKGEDAGPSAILESWGGVCAGGYVR